MRVLVTGHQGYIGSVAPSCAPPGTRSSGWTRCYYPGCDLSAPSESVDGRLVDVRDVRPEELAGFDAVVHLAALSNDPLGDLDAG